MGVGRKTYYYRNLDIYGVIRARELQQYFLQSVLINDNKVPRDWIFTAVYVEKPASKPLC